MRRLSLWMRAHPVFGDSLIAGCVGLPDLVLVAGKTGAGYLLAWLLLAGPLVFRRKRPTLAAYLVLAGGLVQLVADRVPVRPADLALGVMLYTLVADVGRRQAMLYAASLAGGAVLWSLSMIRADAENAVVLFAGIVTLALCWALGEFVGARRAYHVEVERRLRLLELERDNQARIAVAEERARIARELHDVVAHAVSVIVVQADGAGYALRSSPDMAARALQTISETGRQALVELRRLLGVLRSSGDPDGADRAPQPDVGGLSELAGTVRAIGLPVRLSTSGDLDGLPTGISLGVYRIVQESLTNTLKHAGPGAAAEVRVTRLDDRVEVEVEDNGSGSLAGLQHRSELATLSSGNGLIGMRERASVLGGTLEAGPKIGGGWRVRAVLPLGASGEVA
ncbi:two-component sensor histidine kinase [Gandjariella thermophila]|uniref:histidine kinase n=2 Tax=Gandjariella thermophila TaxID=1931992 RepID=A0A4D4J8P3_9PSEU|nr:two-component sensor histidine kinase [Gandjariella thermophila]